MLLVMTVAVLAANLSIPALVVLVEESFVVTGGRELGVVQRRMVVSDSLNILGSIRNIRVIRRQVIARVSAVDALVMVVKFPPFAFLRVLLVHILKRPLLVTVRPVKLEKDFVRRQLCLVAGLTMHLLEVDSSCLLDGDHTEQDHDGKTGRLHFLQ